MIKAISKEPEGPEDSKLAKPQGGKGKQTQTKDTNVAFQIVSQTSPHKLIGFLFLPQAIQRKTFHSQGL